MAYPRGYKPEEESYSDQEIAAQRIISKLVEQKLWKLEKRLDDIEKRLDKIMQPRKARKS